MRLLEFVAVFVSIAAVIALIAFLMWSRIEGSAMTPSLPRIRPQRKSARRIIRDALESRGGIVRRGRWAWYHGGDTFFAFAWLWWRVPARWSMRAFRIVLLDKQVNGS